MTGLLNRVKVFSSSTGTGDVVVGAAFSTKYMTPAEAGAIDGKSYVWLFEQGNDFELIRATWTAASSTIVRSTGTVLWSKISGSVSNSTKITLNNTETVSIVAAAEDYALSNAPVSKSANYTVVGSDRDTLFLCSGTFTMTLTAPGTVGNQFKARFFNTGTGNVTLSPASGNIDGGATAVLYPGDSALVECDGSNFYSNHNYGKVAFDHATTLTESQMAQARQNVYAAPFDALSFQGIQINGSMEIDQEHVGNSTTVAGIYAVDGWQVNKAGTMVCTAQQVSDAPPGYANSLKVTVGTAEASLGASDALFITQAIEGYRTARLAWGGANAMPLSIGFWVKAHRSGAYSGSVRNSALNRSYPFSFTINSADTWEWKTTTITGDTAGTWLTTNGIGLYLSITMAAGTSVAGTAGAWAAANYYGATGTTNGVAATTDVFQITGVVVLPGIELPSSTRAPFIMRTFDIELDACMRYFEKSQDYSTVPGTVGGTGQLIFVSASSAIITGVGQTIYFKKRKRAVPTMTAYSTNTGAATQVYNAGAAADINSNMGGIGETSFWQAPAISANSQGNIQFHWKANARL